jgi:hypothetical protein
MRDCFCSSVIDMRDSLCVLITSDKLAVVQKPKLTRNYAYPLF